MLDKNNGANISSIICVGGSSNMPQVTEGLKQAFPANEIRVFEPEKAIAVGAAIYAQFCDGSSGYLSDIASFSYGIRCYENYNKDPGKMIVLNLVRKGERLPVTRTHGFMTANSDATNIVFHVIESMNGAETYDYDSAQEPIMNAILDFQKAVPRHTKAKLHMTLTTDGILEIMADDERGNKVKVQKKLIF